MDTAVILAAGLGTKLWPYATIRPKAMTPVCARPLIQHTAQALFDAGIGRIHIAAGRWAPQLRACFLGDDRVTVTDVGETSGSAETLLKMRDAVPDKRFLVLYGDVLVAPETLATFIERARAEAPLVLAVRHPAGDSRERLCLRVDDQGHVAEVLGHPRDDLGHWFGGFAFGQDIWALLQANPGYFRDVQVGMMSPLESFLEMTVSELARRQPVAAMTCAEDQALDIDRPWDVLVANYVMGRRWCGALQGNQLAAGASIDPTASVSGYVQLGRNSRIGRNVVIEGNCLVGDETTIDNGALLMGNNIIGDRCTLTNYCYVDEGAVVGHDCVLNHCAELSGVLFDGVYLYHYMEMSGIIGEHTDIGAGTACGTLRFDDGETTILVKGRRERPRHFANVAFLGDFCRTGVNVTIAPGRRIGCYSVIGAGTLVDKDVPDRTLVYVKQDLVEKTWGPEKYGW
jgi:UDP-N-acetylglucosamine diphosphorylase / glucose-1-phosphate thymidylyltransferase / UDP-N-acetylgalactosamine diphosphorylase / glucosamine-1-phosphate N-acetyltransferase / galactosamine-1-phosphate N-acetyltransferase